MTALHDSNTISAAAVKAAALAVGFDACGIARVAVLDDFSKSLSRWIASGRNAEMHFMEQYDTLRCNPAAMVEGAESVICLLAAYNPTQLMDTDGKVARYAYGEDYHERLKRMQYQMIALLKEQYPSFEGRPCVDSAPIAEKHWAVRAGLGWIGRNTLLVNSDYGSWVNLGEIVTSSVVDQYDSPMADGCGECCRCVKACPNHALIADGQVDNHDAYMLDARRCASYHTIENPDDHLPDDIRLSGYIFGCDICQLACPYNQQAATRLEISDERLQQLQSLATCDAPTFKKIARHSALRRIKFTQLQRNRVRKQ